MLAVAGILAAWAIVAALTGGFRVALAGLVVTSRNPTRPFAAAMLAAAVAWRLDRSRVETLCTAISNRIGPAVAQFAVPVAAGLMLVLSSIFCVRAAIAADAFGYVSQSLLWLQGDVRLDQAFAAGLPWPNAEWTLSPLGYRPGDGPRLVPTYAPGLPLIMAAVRMLSPCGPYLIAPACGALLVVLTAALGRRAFDQRATIAGALMVAFSPAVMWWSLTPMSDVPVAAAWIASLLAADRRSLPRALLAGALAGAALLIRPNLALLAIFPVLMTVAAGGDFSGRLRRGLAVCLGVLPFAVFLALVHARLYGSPLTSGYGTVGTIFSLHHAPANITNYSASWWYAHGILGCLFLAAIFRPRPEETRAKVRVLTLFAAAVASSYLFYLPFEDEAYLRFFIPALPVAMLLGADAIVWIAARNGAAITGALLTACTTLAILNGVYRARWDRLYDFGDKDQAFVDAAVYLDSIAPEKAIVLSMVHSGSVRYYAGRQTLRFDILEPAWLDRAREDLQGRGFKLYALLADDEEQAFRSRFAGQRTVQLLDQGPIAVSHRRGEIRLYELGDTPDGRTRSAVEMPRTSRYECRPASPRFGREIVALARP